MREQEESITPEMSGWLAIRDEHILRLEEELSLVAAAFEKRTKELNSVRQEHIAAINTFNHKTKALEAENQRWQADYESLRIQKGGFGFKALLGTGMAATVVGMVLGWVIFYQKEPNSVLFDQFNESAGFKLEYTISQRQYPAAERLISEFNHNKAFQPLQPEFDLLMRLVNAARTSTADSSYRSQITEGYSVTHPETAANPELPLLQNLSITADNGAIMYAEAQSTAQIITQLKKKATAAQWDRTPEIDKIKTTYKGAKGIAEDYWYEVETPDGQRGWVFGFYTNASLKKFKPDVPDSLLLKKDTIKIK
jgi:hypothetical protein